MSDRVWTQKAWHTLRFYIRLNRRIDSKTVERVQRLKVIRGTQIIDTSQHVVMRFWPTGCYLSSLTTLFSSVPPGRKCNDYSIACYEATKKKSSCPSFSLHCGVDNCSQMTRCATASEINYGIFLLYEGEVKMRTFGEMKNCLSKWVSDSNLLGSVTG